MPRGIVKNFFQTGVCLLTGTVLIAGCGSSTTSQETTNGPVTITFWDRHPELKTILSDQITAFEKENPNIKVNLTEVPVTTQAQQYQSAVSGNSLPDVFTLSGYTLPVFVQLNQLHSLNSIITPQIQKSFPDGVFTQGYSMIGNDVYMLPLYAPYHTTEVLYYNKDLLDKYGLQVPKTWSDLENIGNEVYQKSNGKVYGLAMSVKQANNELDQMESVITPEVSGGLNYKTGRYQWNSDGYVQTMDFFKTLFKEHVLHPDSLTFSKQQARGAMASGQAVFEMDGDWGGGLYVGMGFKNFGVANVPTKDGAPYYAGYTGPTPEGISINANTKHWKEASLFVTYLANHIYSAMVNAGLDTSQVVKPDNPLYPQIPQIMNIVNSTSKALPNVYTRNSSAVSVVQNRDANLPKEVDTDILGGYLSGQIKNVSDALKKLTDDYNKVWDQAIKGANGKVKQSDFQFPNWVPLQSYTQNDYASLPK